MNLRTHITVALAAVTLTGVARAGELDPSTVWAVEAVA
jgi:hypothetical protein